MTGMMMFWAVLALATLAIAVISRIYPLTISALGWAGAAALAWFDIDLVYQAATAAALVGLGVYLWLGYASKTQLALKDAGPSRLSGLGAKSNFSAFSDESDEVQVDEWENGDSTDVTFRGRAWRAKLAKGAKAHPGLYKVREVREGKLVLDEVID